MTSPYIEAKTLDDALRKTLENLLNSGHQISPTKGDARELTGVLVEIKNPRARISRTETRGVIFSALGELSWYMSGSDKLDHISYYIPKYELFSKEGRIPGAYGPRFHDWKGLNQLNEITRLLKGKKDSRQAVIQLFDAQDLKDGGEIPCTCTLQFLLRNTYLDLIVCMRSNDAYLGMPHDIFCFTMIQEIVCAKIGAELGIYKHFVGSLHLYKNDESKVKKFLGEGWQSTEEYMPAMPHTDISLNIDRFLFLEEKIRLCQEVNECDLTGMNSYWQDLVFLLEAFSGIKDKYMQRINSAKAKLSASYYIPFIDKFAEGCKNAPVRP